jgi:hypothetical protein
MNGAEMLEETTTPNAGHCPNDRPVLHLNTVAVLFARGDSIYKGLPGCDVYDAERNALTYQGPHPVVAHPPCRTWGTLSHLFEHPPGERSLAPWAVEQVRKFGGVLEHPAKSRLWPELGLPVIGERDEFGGWTLAIHQSDFGHRAQKKTRLYIVGCGPLDLPPMPLFLGKPTHVISQNRTLPGWRPDCTEAEQEHTPPTLANWLTEVARRCALQNAPISGGTSAA